MNFYIIYKYLQTCKLSTNKSSVKTFTRRTLIIYGGPNKHWGDSKINKRGGRLFGTQEYTLEQQNLASRLFWVINETQKLN